jgi:hypothetical protein
LIDASRQIGAEDKSVIGELLDNSTSTKRLPDRS